jgi:hypothetical protein
MVGEEVPQREEANCVSQGPPMAKETYFGRRAPIIVFLNASELRNDRRIPRRSDAWRVRHLSTECGVKEVKLSLKLDS